MRVFLAGATGAIGRRLVPRLVDRGHDVIATTTTPDKLELLGELGAEPVVVDGLDAAAVGEAVARAEPHAVIHQMTALAGDPDLRRFDRWFARTNELRTTGTENLLAASRASGARRFVAQSFTGWPNTREGGPVKSEDDPLDPDPPAAQTESLAAIRFLEQAVLDAPLEGVVLRYGGLYGPGASEGLVELVRARKLPILGAGSGVWSWIHVDDAAAATVAALERGRRIYNIVDDEPAPVSDWLPYLAEQVGARPPMRLPAWLGRLAAGEVAVSLMTQIRGASNAKAKRELGWEPSWPTWREGFKEGLADAPATATPTNRAA
jgi:nucleoside-diphosphate-sugar epimerase